MAAGLRKGTPFMNAIREAAVWFVSTSLESYPVAGIAMVFSALIPIGGCPACWLGGTIGAACEYRPKAPAKE
jgi:hypothetical protein